MARRKKKSFNPFKMFGSYLGALTFSVVKPIPLTLVVSDIFAGFLIGWGIHSIFRRFMK